ncbi:MAG TPA: IS1 family transposase [Terriglobales bacterium]|nr:IS1 family transposase [Terriglobales bacterium]
MACRNCGTTCQRFGKHRNGLRRFRCPNCKRTFTEPHKRTLDAMYVSQDKAILALRLLLEGNSIRSTERITDLDRNTIMKLLVLAGEKCEKLTGRLIRNVPVKDVQADEIWSFIGKKEKRRRPEDDPSLGDAYCFVAIERHSKLVLNFALGKRDQATTDVFVEGLRHATASDNFQITTDGFAPYRTAIPNTLDDRADFAQLIKVYRATPEGERTYSPAEVVSTEVVPVMGRPDPERICTSHVERQNLTMRMQMRRFTRLTNGFSKKFENHWAAVCLWFAYYNFCRIHSTIRVTPAMEAGITDHVWELKELLA